MASPGFLGVGANWMSLAILIGTPDSLLGIFIVFYLYKLASLEHQAYRTFLSFQWALYSPHIVTSYPLLHTQSRLHSPHFALRRGCGGFVCDWDRVLAEEEDDGQSTVA
jgi:hypothetical protein